MSEKIDLEQLVQQHPLPWSLNHDGTYDDAKGVTILGYGTQEAFRLSMTTLPDRSRQGGLVGYAPDMALAIRRYNRAAAAMRIWRVTNDYPTPVDLTGPIPTEYREAQHALRAALPEALR